MSLVTLHPLPTRRFPWRTIGLVAVIAALLVSLLVVAIGMLYLIPQFQGAGLTLRTLTGAPSWVGQLAVAVVVCLNVLPGGMRSVTLVQAFHYWLKLLALLTPLFLLLGAAIAAGVAPALRLSPDDVGALLQLDLGALIALPPDARALAMIGALSGAVAGLAVPPPKRR